MAYTLLHAGVGNHVLCRIFTLRWFVQMNTLVVTFGMCWHSLLYVVIGRSMGPVTSTYTDQTCKQQWYRQMKPFCHEVARIALAIE